MKREEKKELEPDPKDLGSPQPRGHETNPLKVISIFHCSYGLDLAHLEPLQSSS
jgi:hypothetical protein